MMPLKPFSLVVVVHEQVGGAAGQHHDRAHCIILSITSAKVLMVTVSVPISCITQCYNLTTECLLHHISYVTIYVLHCSITVLTVTGIDGPVVTPMIPPPHAGERGAIYHDRNVVHLRTFS